ncbi:MAG: alpha/beta fold hydrolase [Caldilineaceae bacterium]
MFRCYLCIITGFLVALFASACQPIQAPASPGMPAAASYTPRYEPAPCQYEITEADKIECGYLIVPEDRSNPTGPTIRVHVLNFKAKSANPAPDPVILVPGGPGAPTLLYLWWMQETPLGEALRGQRDTLLIEHRGTNHSAPAFYCPELEADVAALVDVSLAEEVARNATALRACFARLVQEGHPLSLYGPVDTAADIADLRLALDYEEVNIYGSSWGTILSFYLLRDHPAGIRSVVLDGPMSPEINQTVNALRMVNDVFAALFQACADDAVCQAAYPGLEAVFYDTLARLRNEPVTVTVQDDAGQSHAVTIDDVKFVNYVLGLGLFGGDFAQMLAGMMAIHNNDYAAVAQSWLGFWAGRHGATGPGTWSATSGVWYADGCLQERATGTIEEAMAAYDTVDSAPSIRDWVTLIFIQDFFMHCEFFGDPGRGIGDSIASDTPTLMLVSRLDQFTPPYFTDAAIARFSQGHRVELPSPILSPSSPVAPN